MKVRWSVRARWLLRTVGALLVLAVFAGAAARVGPVAAAGRADGLPLDLAALVLTPADLAAAGMDGYGYRDGDARSPEQVAAAYAFLRGIPTDEALEIFAEAGLRQAYELRLEEPTESEESAYYAFVRSATTTIYEFADEDGAAAGLEILTDWDGVATAKLIEGDETIGDGSVLTRHEGTTPEPYLALDLAFRVDNLAVVVRIADFTGEEPNVADAERLAERQLERIEEGIDDRESLAAAQTIRLAGDGVSTIWELYVLYDGEYRPSARPGGEDAEVVAERLADLGLTTIFEVSQRIGGPVVSAEDSHVYFTIEQYASADAASDALKGELDRQAESDEWEDLTELDDLAVYGDEAVAFSQTYYWAPQDVELTYLTYYFRVDDRLGWIQIITPGDVSPTALEDLAAAQAACLEGEACVNPVPLPAELDFEDTDAGNGAPPSERHKDSLPPREQTWVGETHGVELTYDTAAWDELPWEYFADEPGLDGDDVLALFDYEVESVITITVFAGTDDADDCVAELFAGNAIAQERGWARPVLDGSGEPIAGGDAERAYAAHGVLLDTGQTTFNYVECRSFADGEALLRIQHIGPLDQYEQGAEVREALLDGLVLPGE